MKSDWKYRKTLRNYEGVIEDGMMVMLEDVEDFPAPALCAFCENPVITQTKSVRSGSQWFKIAWFTVLTAETERTAEKKIVHSCPVCQRALATWDALLNKSGFTTKAKVHRAHRTQIVGGKGGGGHNVTGFQAKDYSTILIGDQHFYASAERS
ncbi:MAG: hypothetical protein Q9199_007643 [Rusavskia elegans]